ncbi:hypothetical protein [Kushneria phosphatilytica]|uniref:Uncharacterized protein n=1 Tax=Kushneria phosphatilytica TaxID=657387 RepID=A0A1S1NU23_9GAMM|nr:hypothetical protein [Kushneria phosphatilytica]OHV09691.1 hypothetical protein BH688_10635 [Kushneria phosphatilytica]QEL11738.1 hypothetical protein FY550_11700 [Kushneria phosphatilytica]
MSHHIHPSLLHWQAHVHVGYPGRSAPGNWLARQLRQLANRLDHGHGMTISCHTRPALAPEAIAECMTCGMRHGERLLEERCRQQAIDQLLYQHYPELHKRP